MSDSDQNKRFDHECSHLMPILLLACTTAALFLTTMTYRSCCFDMLWYGHEWCTASTVVFARNWYREGACRLGFLQLWNPASVEFPDIASRQPYFSAPPGTVLPIWAISRLTTMEPTPAMVMAYNSATHLLITFLLGMMVFALFTACGLNHWLAFAYALIPVYVYTSLPGPMYWQQNVFYSDQAIILPFVAFVFLELLRDVVEGIDERRTVTLVQALALFYGAYTDWFMFVLAGVVYLKRLALRQMSWCLVPWVRHSILFWLPAGVAAALFMWQMHSVGLLGAFLERALMYTGASQESRMSIAAFNKVFWGQHVRRFYGPYGAPLLYATFGICGLCLLYCGIQALRRSAIPELFRNALALLTIMAASPLLYVYLVRNQAAAHEYSTHKLGALMAPGSFVLAPLLVLLLVAKLVQPVAKRVPGRWRAAARILIPALSFCAVAAGAHGYLKSTKHIIGMYMGPRGNPFLAVGTFVGRNTAFSELVVSPSFAIDTKPPQWLCYSMKRVYLTPTLFDVYSKATATVPDSPGDINVLLTNAQEHMDAGLTQLVAKAYVARREGSFLLYKIRKDVMLRLTEALYPGKAQQLQDAHRAFTAGWTSNCVYAADLSGVWATNLLAGRYGLFQRGQSHTGEKLCVWGFGCEKAFSVHPYTQGIGAVIIPLRNRYTRFRTAAAVLNPAGSVTFGVSLDGRPAWSFNCVSSTSLPCVADLDVRGVQQLALTVDPGRDNCNDNSVWIDPWLVPR